MNAEPAYSVDKFLRRLMKFILTPALLIAFLSFAYATVDAKRKGKLDTVRSQIANLYGPLYALSKTSDFVWYRLGSELKPNFDDAEHPPGHDEIVLWRQYITGVVIPLNNRIEETLLLSKEAIRCPTIGDALNQYLAFAQSVKLIRSTWKSNEEVGSKDLNEPKVKYPKRFSSILEEWLRILQTRERKLSGELFGLYNAFVQRAECPKKNSVSGQ